jgi:hypothetical protein
MRLRLKGCRVQPTHTHMYVYIYKYNSPIELNQFQVSFCLPVALLKNKIKNQFY